MKVVFKRSNYICLFWWIPWKRAYYVSCQEAGLTIKKMNNEKLALKKLQIAFTSGHPAYFAHLALCTLL
jgi:hypothetical protein